MHAKCARFTLGRTHTCRLRPSHSILGRLHAIRATSVTLVTQVMSHMHRSLNLQAQEAMRRAKFKFPGRQKIVESRNWCAL